MAGFVAHALGDALRLMVTDAPEWTPTPPFVPLEAPADCAIPAPEGDPFADYDATRPNDTLTRAEALELAIKALKLFPSMCTMTCTAILSGMKRMPEPYSAPRRMT